LAQYPAILDIATYVSLNKLLGGAARGASTIRVKFQMAATNLLKLIELARLLHVDFRSSFGTPFQGVRRFSILSRDR
jgi:hypothetical protein